MTESEEYDDILGTPKDVDESSVGMRLLLPVGRSPWAIAAGYLGLFSVLLAPAPVALLVGLYAVHDIRTHPKRHGMGRALFGVLAGAAGTIFMITMLMD
jgi:hypothetical protein